MKKRVFFLLAASSAAAVQAATPDSDSSTAPVHEVVITATRLEVDPFSVPAAITSVSGDQMRNDALGINLSDDLGSVPGLLARNRNDKLSYDAFVAAKNARKAALEQVTA